MCMLKGVHHQIIEINQTDDPYFERALLFVRVGCADTNEDIIKTEGRRFLKNAKPYSGLCRARVMLGLRYAACMVGGGLSGMFLGMMLSKIA